MRPSSSQRSRCRAASGGARRAAWATMAGSSAETVPKFDLEAPRFDQSTYMGRLSHFLQVSDCGGGAAALCAAAASAAALPI